MPSRSRGQLKSKGLITAINAKKRTTPPNLQFQLDVCRAIEEHSAVTRRRGSDYYKPSSMTCQRQMFYTRTKAPMDEERDGYQGIGMANTGTARHEQIQEVLELMPKYGFKWKYWDVEEFLKKHRWKNGQCKNLKVVGKQGGETALRDDVLHLSFRMDGVVEHLENDSGDPFYLFEFKNQISFKAADKKSVDLEHYAQVETYCLEAELGKALVMYENRDNCALFVPEILIVPPEKRQQRADFILDTEGYVERGIVPPCERDSKKCRYCRFKKQCMKDR